MKSLILLVLILFTVTITASHNITYSVISLISGAQSMGVIIDEKVYPLFPSDESFILNTGEAPIANKQYQYAILKDDIIINKENNTRPPSSVDTKNEYYNRSWNKWELKKLPQILPPLPSIHHTDTDSDLHIDGEIPTIHFVGDQNQLDEMHSNQKNKDLEAKVKMVYISPDKIKTFEGVKVKISGHSTRLIAKLSYKVNIPKEQNLFGYRKLKLRAMVDVDYSYMREFLSYDMYKSVGLPVPRFSYIRIYINSEPIGLFGIAEDIKNPWVRNEFGNGAKDYAQGSLFSGSFNAGKPVGEVTKDPGTAARGGAHNFVLRGGADLSYLGNNLSYYKLGYYHVEAKPSKGEPDFTKIMHFTKFLSEVANTTTDDSVVPLWEDKIDIDSFLRGMAMEILLCNIDGYYILANNYILYTNPETNRLLFSGHDFDISMGNFVVPEVISGNYTEYPNFHSRPLSKILNVPKFKKTFEELLVNISTSLMSEEVLIARIDQVYKMLSDDVEWDRSLPRKGHFQPEILNEPTNLIDTVESDQKRTIVDIFRQIDSYTKAVSFSAIVNGPMHGNFTVTIPLKEWVRTRRSNILKFLG